MKIAIDFDGVLIDHPHSLTFEECLAVGKPVENSIEVLNYLSDKHELFVLTARKDNELAKIGEWLDGFGFPKMRVTNKKENAVIYIDDRAIRFTNWLDVSKLLA